MHHLIKDTEIIQILNHLFQIKGIHKKIVLDCAILLKQFATSVAQLDSSCLQIKVTIQIILLRQYKCIECFLQNKAF